MYAKFFFERFWESDQRNELFVCMPFHDLFDEKFHKIMDVAARKAGFHMAARVKEDKEPNVITDKIFHGIANSKMLLFDVSDDPKSPCRYSKQANLNVLYELGLATAIREPEDILIIREKSSSKLPFDISGITINDHEEPLSVGWLSDMLADALNKQEWYKSKRVKAAAQSIDDVGLSLIYEIGRRPKKYHHFSIAGKPPEVKMAVLRLIDLGLLWLASKCYPDGKGVEHAYRWTPFGYEVMIYLGITQMTEKGFKKLPEYKTLMDSKRKYQMTLKMLEGFILSETRGGKNKRSQFTWMYDRTKNSIKIENYKGYKHEFLVPEIQNILKRLQAQFANSFFPLANNVQKLGNQTEQPGLGTTVLAQKPGDIYHAQGSSYLGVVLEACGYLEWNQIHRGIKWRLINTAFSEKTIISRLKKAAKVKPST